RSRGDDRTEPAARQVERRDRERYAVRPGAFERLEVPRRQDEGLGTLEERARDVEAERSPELELRRWALGRPDRFDAQERGIVLLQPDPDGRHSEDPSRELGYAAQHVGL